MLCKKFSLVALFAIFALGIFYSWRNQWLSDPQDSIRNYLFSSSPQAPLVNVRNGTYVGRHNPRYNQDVFVGIPYAKSPDGPLRLRRPESLEYAWSGRRSATEIRLQCMGHGNSWGTDKTMPKGEDCLYLNVVRPSPPIDDQTSLAVGVWIHGGKFMTGGIFEERYDLGHIVKEATDIGKPFIAVQISYRLGAFGFLHSHEIRREGNTNLGLRDQRMAFQWIQENIAAFGGDPSRVTIWGESAGAASVGQHLIAFGGRDEGLFRAAIMESGNPVGLTGYRDVDYFQKVYRAIVSDLECDEVQPENYVEKPTEPDEWLRCLRNIAGYDELLASFDSHEPLRWLPTVDNDLILDYPSRQIARGEFLRVPIMSGANTDEGVLFAPQGGRAINTDADFMRVLTQGLLVPPGVAVNRSVAQRILAAYPNDNCQGSPEHTACTAPTQHQGAQFRRVASFIGDAAFIANRRLACRKWAEAGVDTYCYRFNAVPAKWEDRGSTHFAEVSFVFNNTEGHGYNNASPGKPFVGRAKNFHNLARLMSRAWASFIVDGDPNSWRKGTRDVEAWAQELEDWPKYGSNSPGSPDYTEPRIYVFDADYKDKKGKGKVKSRTEPDTFRKEAIDLLIELNEAFLR